MVVTFAPRDSMLKSNRFGSDNVQLADSLDGRRKTAQVSKGAVRLCSCTVVNTLLFKIFIAGICNSSSLVDRPNHKALPSATITTGKDSFHVSAEITVHGLDIVSLVHLQSELLGDIVLR